MASCRDCPRDSAPCRDSRQEAKSHGQSLQEAIFQARQSRQEARDHGQSRRKPDMMDSLCRKRKLADSFIPCETVHLKCSLAYSAFENVVLLTTCNTITRASYIH